MIWLPNIYIDNAMISNKKNDDFTETKKYEVM